MRNINKQVQRGMALLSERRQLSYPEFRELMQILANMGNDDRQIDAITMAFYFGAAAGYTQAEADHKEKESKQNGKERI